MEIIVVLLVLILFSALIAPNLVSMRNAQQKRAAYGQITDLISEARLDAVNNDLTYAITWDSGAGQFNLKKEPPNPNATSTTSLASPEARPMQSATSADQFDQVKALTLPSPLTADEFRVGTNNSDPGNWALHFYPDGTSDGGGFQLNSGSYIQSYVVDKYGLSTLIDGTLPDPTDQVWTAGTYAQKI